ncbi:MAG: LPS assembly protein LptD [Pseudomonadota bacterium]
MRPARGISPGRLLRTACLVAGLASAAALAQDAQTYTGPPTALAADLIRIEEGSRLVAEGNVEVISEGRRLTASQLSYDRDTDILTIQGPIVLQDGDQTLVLADAAELDTELQAGILTGARVVLNQRLQIAGAELERSEGRFSDLQKVVASSCEICEDGSPPLWEIRARRVIHDQEEAQIYFYDAQFRVIGVPIAYFPNLRIPDPTVERANGFLTPSARSTNQLGPGIKLPYFITLGDSADLTLTPYVATRFTRTLEGRYRQAFRSGEIEFDGAISRDSLLPDETRGYLFGEGTFDIPYDFELGLQLQTVTDRAYLNDYDYSNQDRLETAIGALRTRPRERIEFNISHFQTLRTSENNDTIPSLVGDTSYDRRWNGGPVGGFVDLELIGHTHLRTSDENVEGRDMTHFRGDLAWRRETTAGPGLRFEGLAKAQADAVWIADDSNFPEYQDGLSPTLAATASLPLVRSERSGATQMLSPIVQFAWTGDNVPDTPNDDSTLTAFDTGNLLGLNRFPGLDRTEVGARVNVALSWARESTRDLTTGLTLGRVYRITDFDQFTPGTGLAGERSNWLTQVDIDYTSALSLRATTLFDSGFEPTINTTRLLWESDWLDLATSYVWQRQDTAASLEDDISELAVDAGFRITDAWSGGVDLRRDFASEQTNRAGLELSYTNECVRVDFSVLQRFRNTEDTEPTTSYNLSVTLAGFGADDGMSRRQRRCGTRG